MRIMLAVAMAAIASTSSIADAQTQYRMRERIVGMPITTAATQPSTPAPVMRTCDLKPYFDYKGTTILHPTVFNTSAKAKAACNSIPDITVCAWNSSSDRLRYATTATTVGLNGTGVDSWAAFCT